MKEKTNRNTKLDIMRAIFLLSVVSAHSSIKFPETTGKMSAWIWTCWQVWSIIGVPGFLILSGYLYKGKAERITTLLKKKFATIIIPWIVCGVMEYLISQFHEYSLIGSIQYLLGYNSYLYYLTILMLCFTILYYFVDNFDVLLACIIVNIISLYLTQMGMYHGVFTNFLNILNWIGYFAIGCVIRKANLLNMISKAKRKALILMSMLPVLSIFIAALIGVKTYFYFTSFFVGILSYIGIYALSCLIQSRVNSILCNIGLWSFAIYLLHMSVVAVLKRIVRATIPDLYVFIPAIVILIFYLVFYRIKKLEEHYPWIKKAEGLIGLR